MSDLEDLAEYARASSIRTTRRPPLRRQSSGWAITGAVIFAMLVLGAIINAISRSERRAATAGAPAASIDAYTLAAQYRVNEVSADDQYKGRVLDVAGVVGRIHRDLTNRAYVLFPTKDRDVQCFFEPEDEGELRGLLPGRIATVRGRCDGLFGNILLRDCHLISIGAR